MLITSLKNEGVQAWEVGLKFVFKFMNIMICIFLFGLHFLKNVKALRLLRLGLFLNIRFVAKVL
jgi:hypothetical protein